MKKVRNPNSFKKILFSLAISLVMTASVLAQEPVAADVPAAEPAAGVVGDVVKGKELFNSQCAACHALYKPMTGPALYGILDKYPKPFLVKWIRNNTELIKAGDPTALKIYNENQQKPMSIFPQLSDADIDDILAYSMTKKPEAAVVAVPDGGGVSPDSTTSVSNNIILGVLALVLLMLVVMLFLVNSVLGKIAKENGVVVLEKDKRLPLWKAFIKNQFLLLVSAIGFLLVAAYFAYGFFMQIGVDQGYEPVQPIHYSHKIHAGDNAIDCNYCHSAARVGKHSNIPSLNVCMNCHVSISEVAASTATEEYTKDFYDKEIQKLYDAVGWDKEKQAYTGKTEPVKWVRIHNLPDFVYFNHSQHVTVAGVDCQTCHGPVEEMEIMRQHSPLTMGWCIECHRETNVKVEDNAYYTKIHEELSKKLGVKKLTAAQMGGLECGKCHY